MKNLLKKITAVFLAVILITGTLSTLFAPIAGAEVSLSGSFSKSTYTVELGDSFKVSINASVSGANLTRVTVNVHDGSNSRLASKEVSGTSYSGSLTVDTTEDAHLSKAGTYQLKLYVAADAGDPSYAIVDYATLEIVECAHSDREKFIYEDTPPRYEANDDDETHNVWYIYDYKCADCGEQLTWNYSVYDEDEAHDLNSEGICVDCGWEEICTHTNTREVVYGQKGDAVSISDTQHKITYLVHVICNGCGENIEDTTSTEKLAHQLDSSGDCEVCDYTKACTHSEQDLDTTITYTVIDEDYHYLNETGHYFCVDCDKEMDPYFKQTKQAHSFSGDTCTECDYQLADLSVSVSSNQSSSTVGSSISASATVNGGSGSYNIAWEVLCGGSRVHMTDYSYPASYSYTADKAGSWTFKVHVQDKSTGETKTAVTSAITVKTPVTQAPVTQAPVTQAPVTQAPVTGTPDYSAPDTPPTQVPSDGETCDHEEQRTPINTHIEKHESDAYQHYEVKTYKVTCKCGKVNTTDVEKTPVECQFTYQSIQELHEAQGHQYFERCDCGNAHTTGEFKLYLSSCETCLSIGLGRGCKGAEVRELQTMLVKLGTSIAIDGDFGGNTETAVKNFQTSVGLTPSGIVDAKTKQALLEKYLEKINEDSSNPVIVAPGNPSEEDKQEQTKPDKNIDISRVTETRANAPALQGVIDISLKNDSDGTLDKTKGLYAPSYSLTSHEEDEKDLAAAIIKNMMAESSFESISDTITAVDRFDTVVSSGGDAVDLMKDWQEAWSDFLLIFDDAEGAAEYLKKADKLQKVSDGFAYAGPIIEGVLLVLKVNEIDNMSEAEREQLASIVTDACNYEKSMNTLDVLINSSSDHVQNACKEVRAELQASYNKVYGIDKSLSDIVVQIDGIIDTTHDYSSLAFDTVVGKVISPMGIYSFFTPGIEGMVDAQIQMVDINNIRNTVYMDLSTAVAEEDDAAHELFDLYCAVQAEAFNTAEAYYLSFDDTVQGFNNENVDLMMKTLEDERREFMIESNLIRMGLTE